VENRYDPLLYYISGHGFGHASRAVEIINALGAVRPDLAITVRTDVSPQLLARTIKVPYRLQPGACDSGIIQASAVTHHDLATIEAAVDFYTRFEDRIAAEIARVGASPPRVVVGDIPPLAFEVAQRLGVPSVAVSNFTWDWIYETHPGLPEAAPWVVPLIRQAYAKATLALELPFAGGFEVFPAVRRLPLVARQPTRTRRDTRRHFHVPEERPAVLLSFGGYGLPELDFGRVDCFDRWTVVTTDRIRTEVHARLPHLVCVSERAFVDSGFRYEDLVAAVDAVLTKPGYGIVAECIAAGTAMVYTSRGHFREYAVLVEGLQRYARSRFLPQEQLFLGEWRAALDAVLLTPPPAGRMAADGAAVAAAEISAVAR